VYAREEGKLTNGISGHEVKYFNPRAIAERVWEVYAQEEKDWTLDVTISGGQ
jgi:hypothetical protein